MMGEAWVERRTAGAPAALHARVRQWLRAAPEDPWPERLARAAGAALDRVIAGSGDRAVALDLLAADALVTLALEAQADEDPARLEAFARRMRPGGDPTERDAGPA